VRQLSPGCYIYAAHVRADRPSTDYTPRIVPHHAGVSVPLEASYIKWQR
jgi:glycogen phosphorylase